ncbi:hypothetical protein [Streptomyces sp. NPDC002540]
MKRPARQPTDARLLAGIGAPVAACSDLVFDLHVRRGQQGVQVVRHTTILDALSAFPDAERSGRPGRSTGGAQLESL